MKVYLTRVNKNNYNDIAFFKYKGNKTTVSLAFWYEQLEPRYMLNKTQFLNLWKSYMNCSLDIVHEGFLKPDVLIEYLTFFYSSKLETFLEKIWINYKFMIVVK